MLQYLLLLCALAIPGILALAVPVIEATAEDPKCLDIIHCRTLTNIVWSCLITIFACTWVSIHHNVVLDSESRKATFYALWERVWVTALTLLVPEYTLAWAVRQWIMARQIARRFNNILPGLPRAVADSADIVEPAIPVIHTTSLQEKVREGWERGDGEREEKWGKEDREKEEKWGKEDRETEEGWETEARRETEDSEGMDSEDIKRSTESRRKIRQRMAEKIRQDREEEAREERERRGREREEGVVVGSWTRFKRTALYRAFSKRYSKTKPWTTTHGFFVLMGGFYHFHGDEPH
ncbi:hypothetical protein FIBSPDRAFT_937003, partial [Athelia psychrophila]